MKQEQEPAKQEVTEVGDNVLRLELDISMPGLGHVNCYALTDKDGVALVDPGLPGPKTYETLVSRLKQADLAIKDIHSVIVTHSHPDHFGGAARIAREAGAKVIGHANFSFGPAPHHDHTHDDPCAHSEASVDDLAAHDEAEVHDEEALEAVSKAVVSHYVPSTPERRSKGTPWGGESAKPPLKMLLKWRFFQLIGKSKWYPEISDHVHAGDVLKLAGREWFVVHTPGHTEDHICLHDPENKMFVAGDHILPTITPHISGVSQRVDPLNAFFESLDQVAEIPDVESVIPAHGHPFNDLAGRAESIKHHHFERLDAIKDIGRELGPASVTDFSHKLFKKRSWGAMAESETYAHLEHLRIAGDAEVYENKERKLIYTTG
ncbi:MAG: MBL fold metallo-hydrolase [Myxococcota bacterium]|jgi:glyoxylase-like metal-dependent hydrolase (beta-lactamase superfamily II)|nr:MBL fold metallo-hydrolase [Myxococcota bacterium]